MKNFCMLTIASAGLGGSVTWAVTSNAGWAILGLGIGLAAPATAVAIGATGYGLFKCCKSFANGCVSTEDNTNNYNAFNQV